VDTLSGGERRRAYLGMILAQDTPLMILDEATANMDLSVETYFWRLVSEMRMKQGKTVIAVMHNLSDAVRFADRILLLCDGALCFAGTTAEFLETTLAEDIMDVKRYTTAEGVFFLG
jgi:iron complex transport system ATP-binding protein